MSSEVQAVPDAEPVGLTVAAVARRMGVAPATLRTWDRRYGVGPSEHRPGSHRRYSVEDVARLEHMRRLVIAGYPPADAARAACGTAAVDVEVPSVDHSPVPAVTPSTARAGGGRVVALPGASSAARGLARAAQSLDAAGCTRILTDTLEREGVVPTWDNLIVPVLCAVGEQWSQSGRGIEIEHLLSAAVQDALSSAVRTAEAPVNSRTVLLACAADEMHALVLWGVAAALAERRIGARILGASLPASALAEAVKRLGPAAVFVWAQIPGSSDPASLSAIPAQRPAAALLIGGPGWTSDADTLPDGVIRVTDLTDTVGRIAHAVGG